jgi:hypothetical protein
MEVSLMSDSTADVTQMLRDWRSGDRSALDSLMPIVYDELRRIASRYLSRRNPNQTLQTTALVHEAYMRLIDRQDLDWQSRTHFYAVAATLGISVPTVKREWKLAKAWLRYEMNRTDLPEFNHR